MGSNRKQTILVVLGVVAVVVAVTIFYFLPETVSGKTPEDRISSIRNLANDPSPRALDAIAAAASDPDPQVRRMAIACLNPLARPKDRPVFEEATRDDAAEVRQAAARALMRAYRDDQAAQRVGELLHEDPDREVQETAAPALANARGPKALVILFQAMESEDENVLVISADAWFREKQIPVEAADDDPMSRRILIEMSRHGSEIMEAFEEMGVPLTRDEEVIEYIANIHICSQEGHDHTHDLSHSRDDEEQP